MESLNNENKADLEYQQLIKTIQVGFPKTQHLNLLIYVKQRTIICNTNHILLFLL